MVETNDLADDGEDNGSVPSTPTEVEHRDVPTAVEPGSGDLCARPYRNPCPAGALGVDRYPVTVRRHVGADGAVAVESWFVHGLSHNYPGGDPEGTFTDPHGPDVTTAAYEFFERAAR